MLWVILVIFGALAFGAIAAPIAAEKKTLPDPHTWGRPETVNLVRDEFDAAVFVPAYEEPPSPWQRCGLARRVILLSLALFVLCIVAAYALPQPGHAPPNLIWLLVFAPWPGAVALFTALGSWLATGRL